MAATLTQPWTICCRLVRNMKGVRKIVFLLTVVAIVIAGVTISTVDLHESRSARQEETTHEDQPVQNERPVLVEDVEKPVEVVQDEEPIKGSETEAVPMYDEEAHEILSIIIYQEAGGDKCSDDTRRKVGSVFLNRVASPLFPDTYEEVATGHKQYGTLYITGIKWPERASLEEEAHAVQRAKDIAEELLFSGSILPPDVIWQAEFPQGDGLYCYQDGIYFCYSEVSE